MKRILLLLIFNAFFATMPKAQSAVYFDYDNGAIGWAHGMSSQEEAEDSAYAKCLKAGAHHPQLIASTGEKGYGAIAVGSDLNSRRVIGVTLAEDDKKYAEDQARWECQESGGPGTTISIAEEWDDE